MTRINVEGFQSEFPDSLILFKDSVIICFWHNSALSLETTKHKIIETMIDPDCVSFELPFWVFHMKGLDTDTVKLFMRGGYVSCDSMWLPEFNSAFFDSYVVENNRLNCLID